MKIPSIINYVKYKTNIKQYKIKKKINKFQIYLKNK